MNTLPVCKPLLCLHPFWILNFQFVGPSPSIDAESKTIDYLPLVDGNDSGRTRNAMTSADSTQTANCFYEESFNYSCYDESTDLSTTAVCPGIRPQHPAKTRLLSATLQKILHGEKSDEASDSDKAEKLRKTPQRFSDDQRDGRNCHSENQKNVENASGRTGGTPTAQNENRSQVNSTVPRIRGDPNRTLSESSTYCPKVSKRKQVFPMHLDGSQLSLLNNEVLLCPSFSVMQEPVDVAFERRINGEKRKLDQVSEEPAVLDTTTEQNVTANALRMAAVISNEIQLKLRPIVTSIVTNFFRPTFGSKQSSKGMRSHHKRSKQRTQTCSGPLTPNAKEDSTPSAFEQAKKIRSRTSKGDGERPTRQSLNEDVQMPPKASRTKLENVHGSPHSVYQNQRTNDNSGVLVPMVSVAEAGAFPLAIQPGDPHVQDFFPRGLLLGGQQDVKAFQVRQKIDQRRMHEATDARVTPRDVNTLSGGIDDRGTPPHHLTDGLWDVRVVADPSLGHPYRALQGFKHSDFSPYRTSMVDDDLTSSAFFLRSRGSVDRGEKARVDALVADDQASIVFVDSEIITGGLCPSSQSSQGTRAGSLGTFSSSTLTTTHLRKAKLIFFYTRYPSPVTLKPFFSDVKFDNRNTAQLLKWFSNFREFYYSQIEKFAKQVLTHGVQNAGDIRVSKESELYRILNSHFNHIDSFEVPDSFLDVVEQTVKEFFKALQAHTDVDPTWKKPIYKIIHRLDEAIPELFYVPIFSPNA